VPSQTKKITFDTVILFSGKVIGLLLGMIRLNYLSRFLGVSNFGILNFALYFCSLFQVLFDLGIAQLLIRDVSRDLSRSREFLGKATVLKGIIVFLAGLVVGTAGAVSHFAHVTNMAILLTAVVFAINGISTVFLAAFQAHRKMTVVSLYNIFNDLALSVLVILLIGRYPYVNTVLIFNILVAFGNLLLLIVLYWKQMGRPQFEFDKVFWKELLQSGTPIAISSLGISMYMFIGPTVLKYTRGDFEVGLFSAGYKIISILTLIPMTLSQVVYPIFSNFYATAREKLQKALADSLRVIAQISIPLGVGTVIIAPKLIALLYPPAFHEATIVLQVIICGDAIVYLGWIIYAFLLALDRQRTCMTISLIGAAVAIIVNLILVPRFGFQGAAYAIMLVDIFLFVLYVYSSWRAGYTIGRLSSFLKIIAAGAIMGVVLLFTSRLNLFMDIFLGAVVYFVALYAMSGFGDQEKEFLGKIFQLRRVMGLE